ncbi:MAG TPA: sigma-70 family RNA polymerase sigma factor [Phenylobacterium sp.]|uniref:RNA polymerase sigma factor n=1 Tax=Phenylobacterium sp. TaxID=1871053 RepID=UPI002B46883A|nr:sigma-70 family RNA polymerase sigma factor [Phenylobacterium sp.]HKR89888.1 sigma-70 family RNA polymerase sigma factor [Phenylobacterium sp.]
MLTQETSSETPRSLQDLRAEADDWLFLAAQAGDHLAFRVLVERHVGLVRRLALNVLRDELEAEDVTQEVFVSAWRNRASWRPEAKFTTWLYRIAMNRAIDCYRSRRPTPQPQEELTRLIDRDAGIAVPPRQEEEIEQQELSGTLRSALQRLPATQRRAIELFYYEDMEVARIAEVMVTSEQSVRSLLKRGRQALKFRLRSGKSLPGHGSRGVPGTARAERNRP